MLWQPPDPPGLRLWNAKSHIAKTHQGVRIDALSAVRGRAELIFATHALISASGGSATYKIAALAPIHVEKKDYCAIFLPKDIPLIFQETDIECVTIVRLPEGLFKYALRGIANYDSMLFRAYRDGEDQVLRHAANLMRSIAMDDDPTPQEIIAPLLNSMVSRILLRVEGAPHQRARVISDAHITVLNAFIDTNVARSIRLPELSRLVGLSVFHFSREFKIATNISPMRYVLERRVAKSKLGLATTRPLAEVALDAGFSSQSHFATAFRLVTGMTPSAWRAAN